jgi:hypothetical protein
MKYVLELSFKASPECISCMFGRYGKKSLNGESIMCCYAIGNAPKCPEEGCRKDCPLREINE